MKNSDFKFLRGNDFLYSQQLWERRRDTLFERLEEISNNSETQEINETELIKKMRSDYENWKYQHNVDKPKSFWKKLTNSNLFILTVITVCLISLFLIINIK